MNNFSVLLQEKWSLDHGVWFEVVGMEESKREMMNLILDEKWDYDLQISKVKCLGGLLVL